MNRKKSKVSRRVQVGVALAAAAATVGAFFVVVTGKGSTVEFPAYTVARVIDGDTFVTAEKQNIRIASIEAPETGLCGAQEAKAELERLVLGKPVYLKVVYRDFYQRLVSYVYTKDSFVNQALVAGGFAYHYRGNADDLDQAIITADAAARQAKKGIFSNTCTQTVNTAHPTCTVKGNNRNGKIYYLPSCGIYPNVEVQLYLGDQWFCSEKAAIAAGFRKPVQCP